MKVTKSALRVLTRKADFVMADEPPLHKNLDALQQALTGLDSGRRIPFCRSNVTLIIRLVIRKMSLLE